ncbi:MAG: tetratricopeptide repeat protein, partial [Gemmatimonadota bacterium]
IVEIHRRSLWQVLLIYCGAALVAYQAVQALTEGLGLPQWFPAFAIVLFIVGLPIVLATAFVHEVAPPTVTPAEPTPLTEAEAARVEVEAAAVHLEARRRHRFLTWRNAAATFVIMLAAWGIVATGWLVLHEPGATPPAGKSVAVLPFVNMSADPENEYFSDGITDAIITHLTKIADLKVTSRTSSMQYKGADKSLLDIAAELGVTTIVEGSVQQTGDRVRVNAQLIDAQTDEHLWAEIYDRDLTDIFAVQSDIAQQIVAALQATLTPAEKEVIERKPTDNMEAYGYYLQAKEYYHRSEREEDTRSAMQMVEAALELDPEFAQAWAFSSSLHALLHWYYWDRSEERLAQARSAADRALELQPGMGEAYLALGDYYYQFLDYDRALEQYELARSVLPNDADVWAGIGWVRRRQGEFDEAINNLTKAFELNPRSAVLALNIGDTYRLVRNYAEAERYYDRAILLNLDWSRPYASKAMLYVYWQGDLEKAWAVLDEWRERSDSTYQHYAIDLLFARRYSEVLEWLSSYPSDVFAGPDYFEPKALSYAEVYRLLDRPEQALTYCDSARVILEAELLERPNDERLHSALGLAYAGLGRKEDAIREGQIGVDLMPLEKEAAWQGPRRLTELTEIYILVGEYDAAIDELDHLLSIPSLITAPLLRIDPTYDPLRDHPRFQALVEKYE